MRNKVNLTNIWPFCSICAVKRYTTNVVHILSYRDDTNFGAVIFGSPYITAFNIARIPI